MDYRTLFTFDVVSLVVYATAITIIALRNRKMFGLGWFAASVLLQLAETVLQVMRGIWPPTVTILLPTILNGLSFYAMYMGFQWTLRRRPIPSQLGPILLYASLIGYACLYFLHVPFDFTLGMAPVFVSAGLSAGLLLRMGRGHFLAVARVTASVLFTCMCLTIYRTVVMVAQYGFGSPASGPHGRVDDPRILYSTLGLMATGGCLVLMYLWFFVAERWGDLALTARLDPLTGVLNRRAIDDGARREISRARRTGAPLALLLIDIDHFKLVNDIFGHRGGDEALRSFVASLQVGLRQIDLLGRIGGEEFVMFLPDTTASEAAFVAERLRTSIELAVIPFEDREIRLTMTAGVTQLLPGEETWEGMLTRADEALYKGKQEGRNRVVLDPRALTIQMPPVNGARRFQIASSLFRRKKTPDQLAG
jgi:diguanylate cyclase (GGDEF)-like protein